MLEVSNLSVSYGGIAALREVSLTVPKGDVVALVGSNGAGKSTLIRALAGLVRASGSARLRGAPMERLAAHARARLGLAVVPEHRRLFGGLTVRDNLLLGAYTRSRLGRISSVELDLDEIYALFPRLKERQGQLAQTMSGGEQQMLAIGRSLMARPQVILMDEPSIGLAPQIVQEIFRVIARLRDEGRTILLVEQNAAASLRIADYGYVLDRGRITLEGPASELADSDAVRKLYLGG
ncbi:MAG: ABC transporter ATP-binding protein [Rubrivivax sp.]